MEAGVFTLNLGKIFRVEERAEALVAEMRAEEKAVREMMKDVEPVSLFVYDSGEGTLYTIGGSSLENELVKIAGGKNIFEDVDKQHFSASIESVIEAEPEAIAVLDYLIDVNVKLDYLKGIEEMSDVPAIKNNNIFIVPRFSILPSVQNINAIKEFAKGLHPELFD